MRLVFFAVITFCAASLAAHADTLAGTSAGTNAGSSGYYGQSFTSAGAGIYSDITFNFENQALAPYAIGTGYLFSTEYTGSPNGLSSSDAGFLGEASASGGIYAFGSSLSLAAGQTYFFYEDALIPTDVISGGSLYAGTLYYISDSASNFFAIPGEGANFNVSGQPSSVPEPSSFVLLGTGFLGVVSAMRKRFA